MRVRNIPLSGGHLIYAFRYALLQTQRDIAVKVEPDQSMTYFKICFQEKKQ